MLPDGSTGDQADHPCPGQLARVVENMTHRRNANLIALGLIIGSRDFFPDALVSEIRRELLALLERLGVNAVTVSPEQTKVGHVERFADVWARAGGIFILCKTFSLYLH